MSPPVNAIGIQLYGRLGNQMFQYAAARLLAERLGCRLLVAGHTPGKEPGLIKHWIRRRKPAEEEWSELGILRRAFGEGPGIVFGRIGEVAMPRLRRHLFPRTFSPRRYHVVGDIAAEVFDESYFQISPGTWLDGYFQSERYFAGNADRVRRMFHPSDRQSRAMDTAVGEWPARPAEIAAIHIRRGDYLEPRGELTGGTGLELPASYYHDALRRLPPDTPVAIFSDDPDWASLQFPGRRVWLSRGRSAAVDMLLMAQCRWVVTANSSFSWWGGWLNERPDREVFAPLHHLGWRVGKWFPRDIDVPAWTYLQVQPGSAA